MILLWARLKLWAIIKVVMAYNFCMLVKYRLALMRLERERLHGKRSWKKPIGILRSDELRR